MQSLNRQLVREVDRRAVAEYGMSGLVLMENAGRGTADVLCSLVGRVEKGDRHFAAAPQLHETGLVAQSQSPFSTGYVAVCCGKGNNGGDGFVLARHLDLRRVPVRVLLLANPAELTGDAAANFRILAKCDVPIVVCCWPSAESGPMPVFDKARFEVELAGAAWIVDALLGTGATGNPRAPYDTAIRQINAAGKSVLAIDLPSGLDCDTGQAFDPTIRAAHTCTFVAAKPGFFAVGAEQYTGQLHTVDIGAPRRLIDEISSNAN
jgi:NAD(P)H-hydrate epimerase